jgi:hypothetical protein
MAEQQAKVSSIEAIEQFRSVLLVFLSKARPTLEEIISEVNRTKNWLENDQLAFWDRQMKVRRRDLDEAQAELFSARISTIQQASAAQQMAVQRAMRAVREAEDKMRILKKWSRDIENRSDPMVKEIEQLHGFITVDMGRAVAYLTEIIKALQAYSDITSALPSAGPAPAGPSAPDSPEQPGDVVK